MLALITSLLLGTLVMLYVQRKRQEAVRLQEVRVEKRRQMHRQQRPF